MHLACLLAISLDDHGSEAKAEADLKEYFIPGRLLLYMERKYRENLKIPCSVAAEQSIIP